MFRPRYVILFNHLLSNAIDPSACSLGIIILTFKNKGNFSDPSNYRPITLSSCLSKLFSLVSNTCLTKFILRNNVLNINQGAFLPGSSTVSHIFSLNFLLNILQNKKQTLFCAFLDSAKGHDTV